MRAVTLFALAALTIAFWGLVWWVADAFEPLELAAILGGGLVLLAGWFRYEIRHAVQDPHEREPAYVPSEWEWPAIERRSEDRSLRHPGLGK